ncbi:unnamed protein product [Vitrella brassicaformis CCMP3155]|uniref:Uncharacterized protein n=2 Tax=Vitrella brassicaformis TaxID=1169539 RepID=A0A0G4FRX1_VITBC|nr:unnamed protein product [Vitrella brassicaformis CCMP3155]|eukprot:CEM17395.1 unnamed protein product [Vitrella brassicaformis CCMP3155]
MSKGGSPLQDRGRLSSFARSSNSNSGEADNDDAKSLSTESMPSLVEDNEPIMSPASLFCWRRDEPNPQDDQSSPEVDSLGFHYTFPSLISLMHTSYYGGLASSASGAGPAAAPPAAAAAAAAANPGVASGSDGEDNKSDSDDDVPELETITDELDNEEWAPQQPGDDSDDSGEDDHGHDDDHDDRQDADDGSSDIEKSTVEEVSTGQRESSLGGQLSGVSGGSVGSVDVVGGQSPGSSGAGVSVGGVGEKSLAIVPSRASAARDTPAWAPCPTYTSQFPSLPSVLSSFNNRPRVLGPSIDGRRGLGRRFPLSITDGGGPSLPTPSRPSAIAPAPSRRPVVTPSPRIEDVEDEQDSDDDMPSLVSDDEPITAYTAPRYSRYYSHANPQEGTDRLMGLPVHVFFFPPWAEL